MIHENFSINCAIFFRENNGWELEFLQKFQVMCEKGRGIHEGTAFEVSPFSSFKNSIMLEEVAIVAAEENRPAISPLI